MSLIQIKDLSFTYPGSLEPVFENVSLDLDTDWRLGLVGRNGRGKTTFLRLLKGALAGTGRIVASEQFEYFPVPPPDAGVTALAAARATIAPFDEWERQMQALLDEGTEEAIEAYGEIEQRYAAADGYVIDELIGAEVGKLRVDAGVLGRPFETLSGGEKVKLLLAAMFLKKHSFLLIDEPTDHLDAEGRRTVAKWLAGKSSFILVSHDRDFLDEAVDHVMAINRADIELVRGNYSTWRHQRELTDAFERAENEKLEGSIKRLRAAAERTERWSDQVEASKKVRTSDTDKGGVGKLDRGYIGHQAARMMQRSKAIVRRQEREIGEKERLLKNIEEAEPLKIHSLPADKSRLVTVEGLCFGYGERRLIEGLDLTIDVGERIAVRGANGCGKSTLLHLLMGDLEPTGGSIRRYGGLVMSSLPQETGHLQGDLRRFAAGHEVEYSLFLAILRKLEFEREAFERPIEGYSTGQKKKVCLAASLAKPAHLFVWDEPLDHIDVHSREQVEKAVLEYAPTMVFVEHDAAFSRAVATRCVEM